MCFCIRDLAAAAGIMRLPGSGFCEERQPLQNSTSVITGETLNKGECGASQNQRSLTLVTRHEQNVLVITAAEVLNIRSKDRFAYGIYKTVSA